MYSIYIVVVYKVLSIYRVLPGFGEIPVFEKINRFFIHLFLNCSGQSSSHASGYRLARFLFHCSVIVEVFVRFSLQIIAQVIVQVIVQVIFHVIVQVIVVDLQY